MENTGHFGGSKYSLAELVKEANTTGKVPDYLVDGDIIQGLNPSVFITSKLASMTDQDIMTTWDALSRGWDSNAFLDPEHGITMDNWAEAVYFEKTRRGL